VSRLDVTLDPNSAAAKRAEVVSGGAVGIDDRMMSKGMRCAAKNACCMY